MSPAKGLFIRHRYGPVSALIYVILSHISIGLKIELNELTYGAWYGEMIPKISSGEFELTSSSSSRSSSLCSFLNCSISSWSTCWRADLTWFNCRSTLFVNWLKLRNVNLIRNDTLFYLDLTFYFGFKIILNLCFWYPIEN